MRYPNSFIFHVTYPFLIGLPMIDGLIFPNQSIVNIPFVDTPRIGIFCSLSPRTASDVSTVKPLPSCNQTWQFLELGGVH